MSVYHYTYRITNIIENKHYYGIRSSKVEPKLDLGIKYFSSSTNKDFINDQKENPEKFKYKIIKIFKTRKQAIELEIKLHTKFDVAVNEYFYNISKQTSTGWDVMGTHWKLSDDTKKKMSKWQLGKKLSDETKEKISQSLIGKTGPNKDKKFSDEWKNNMKKPKSEEHKQKISSSQSKNYNENDELKFKLQNWIKENGHPRNGLKHSEESKNKIREKAKGRKFSDDVNKSKGRPGKIWVSNDELKQNKMIYLEDIEDGWYKGRTKF